MRAEIVAALRNAGLDPDAVAAVVAAALAEDLAGGPDVTTEATVPAGAVIEAAFVPRQDGVLAGGPVALAVIDAVAGDLGAESYTVVTAVPDGTSVRAGMVAIGLSCPAAVLLSAERTALNLLTHLSGVATATRAWVAAVAGTGAQIRDTRKTLPGLRALEKYAVRCGGGVNHRMSLSDAALIKDNHVAAAGSVRAAVEAVRARRPDLPLEVEVDTLDQFDEAMAVGATLVLLDNFSIADTAEAVRRGRRAAAGGGGRVRLESSGGLTLERAHDVAATGVDFLAIGALTHSAAALDIGLDVGQEIGLDVGLEIGLDVGLEIGLDVGAPGPG
jgi:nicotinate-nucleotide pyrophosphorylase (carboxylating)